MRLAHVTGVEVARRRSEPPGEPPAAAAEFRVVAYVAEQARPVYISEARRPDVAGGYETVRFHCVSFGSAAARRSYRLALQLWIHNGSWTIADDWVVDLRHVRRASAAAAEPLVLHTGSGPVVPVVPGADVPRAPTTRPQSIASVSSKPSQSLPFRLFGWGAPGDADAAAAAATAPPEPAPLESLSFATLVDLWTLQHSLDDARAASSAVSAELNRLIPKSILPLRDRESVLTRRLAAVQKQTRLARERAQQVRSQAGEQRGHDARLDGMLSESTAAARRLDSEVAAAPRAREGAEDEPRVASEQSRLAAQLLDIFPIDPVENAKFHFTIRGLALPSVFAINHYNPQHVGAALGFVAQVVVLLGRYLDVALPYPITVYGSQSFITDHISSIKHGSNKFPLWTRGALLYRVEYALYLLHKDIEQLMSAVDLPVADLKQTLANLKNLLLVVSHR